MTIKHLVHHSLRGVLVWCTLAAIGFLFIEACVGSLLPFIQTVVDVMQSDYDASLALLGSPSGPHVVMTCTASHLIMLPGGGMLPPLASFQCAWIDAIHVMVPVVIFLGVVFGGSIADWREMLRRLGWAALLLPVVVAVTCCPLLIGLAGSGFHTENSGYAAQLRVLLQPMAFMELGGCWLIPLAAALVCLRLAAAKDK